LHHLDPYQIFHKTLITNIRYSSELKLLNYGDRKKRDLSATYNTFDSDIPGEMRNGDSPYPLMDQYIIRVLTEKDGKHAFIRGWTYFRERKMIVYQIGGSRYCENIGRQHKSNHIIMIVDLHHNIFYQKCMDPDCKKAAFKSSCEKIPSELISLIHMKEDEKMFEGINDEDLFDLGKQIII
jgi:hypothetical protein